MTTPLDVSLIVLALVGPMAVATFATGFVWAAVRDLARIVARRLRGSRPAAVLAAPRDSAAPHPPLTRPTGDRELDALVAQAEREGALAVAWVVVEDDGVVITFRRFDPMRSAAMPAEVGEEVGRAVAEAVAEAQTPGGRVLTD